MHFPSSDTPRTGHADIDREHLALLAIIDRLAALVGDGDREAIAAILDDLTNNVIGHFGREEQMMIQSRYPAYDEHMLLHSQFFASLTQFIFMFEMNEVGLTESMQAFLGQWFRDHETGHDRAFIKFFQAGPDSKPDDRRGS